VASTTGWQQNETVTGTTSGATSKIFKVGATSLYTAEITGVYQAAETITGSVSGASTTITQSATNILLDDNEVFNEIRYLKEIYLRDKIQKMPGQGPARGAYRHLDIALGVRDFNDTEARMYKSTATGWQQIVASYVVFFDAVTDIALLVHGATVSDGTNTATLIAHSVKNIGASTGYVVLTGAATGFANNDSLSVGGSVAVTLSTDAELVTLEPGGRFEWYSYNFTGGAQRYRVYCCDGVNPAFEYDPTTNTIAPIYTDIENIATDTPKFLATYRNHLFLGFADGKMRNSEPGNPFLYDAAAGTIDFSIGAPISGFDSTAKALLIATTRDTFALTGQVAENFTLDLAADRVGAKPFTMAHISTTYMLDDRGVVALNRAQEFGNFQDSTISRLIQPLLNDLKNTIVASITVLSTNTYKMYTEDGKGVTVTFQEGQAIGFGFFDLGIGIYATSTAEDDLGQERILASSTDGHVYELERGRSFDGASKSSWLRTVYHFLESPAYRKKFYRAFIGAVISGTATLKIGADFSLGTDDANSLGTITETVKGQDGSWDVGQYDTAVFDGKVVSDVYLDLDGTGESISLIFNHDSPSDDIFTLKDILYSYKMRRPQRARR
jgi:hypothetical protein